METDKFKGLLPKLAALQSSVRGLGKDTKGNSYEYVSGSKVLDAVRPRMDELGLLLVQEVEDVRNERVDYSVGSGPQARQKSEMFTSVSMVFTWIDAESGEKLPVRFAANGCNGWDKGLGSALTYGERYFLLKFFHIATDEDDVDARQGEEAAPVAKPDPQRQDGEDLQLLGALQELRAATSRETLLAINRAYKSIYGNNPQYMSVLTEMSRKYPKQQ